MFSIGQTYSWVVLALPVGFLVPLPFYMAHRMWPKAGFDYVVTPAVSYFLGYLSSGINSSVLMHFVLAFFVQLWVRKRYPKWFLKYVSEKHHHPWRVYCQRRGYGSID